MMNSTMNSTLNPTKNPMRTSSMKAPLRLRFASPVILVSAAWLGGSAFATPPGQFRLRLEP